MDLIGILANKPVEEEEKSMLTVGFSSLMQKRVADLEDESTPISNGKHPS